MRPFSMSCRWQALNAAYWENVWFTGTVSTHRTVSPRPMWNWASRLAISDLPTPPFPCACARRVPDSVGSANPADVFGEKAVSNVDSGFSEGAVYVLEAVPAQKCSLDIRPCEFYLGE